ncbi:single-stranded DNA-binding protein [Listeria monocytogenes]|nr:single-stranded DNA-binding protein [Listeria monocytogenes]EAE8422584.1 single-stranded DNA-binding protein [Listeria monocytogenes]EAF8941943.1 single-stranded DNA-binding protein [Listeria monocytogenes]EAF8947949.1 single-stranded DNA-binding protein [Listeria monocytogenes]EAF8953660.1 single-stranded DNA-binding protein [Listeria monocytogenes]
MDVNELLDYAIIEAEKIKIDEVFLVKDLFKGYEWNRIPRKNRLLLGTLFLNYINKEKTFIIPIEKTSSGQQKYKKIK